ncbi:Hypothetical protein D9617_15g043890 [Elsinoe fawcettii]|nr:Hypothetical protein D9617_15g043890 [Elsinoe fawcettii]
MATTYQPHYPPRSSQPLYNGHYQQHPYQSGTPFNPPPMTNNPPGGFYAPPSSSPLRVPPAMTLSRPGHWYSISQPLTLSSSTTNLILSEYALSSSLSLHQDSPHSAPLAEIKTHLFGDAELGLSDLSGSRVLHWTKIRTDLSKGRKQILPVGTTEFTVPGPSGGRTFKWARHVPQPIGMRMKGGKRELQLTDASGRIVAMFELGGFHGKHRGEVQWREAVGAGEEVAALMVLARIYVRERERAKKARKGQGRKFDHAGYFDLTYGIGGDGGGGGGGSSGGDGGGGCGGDGGGGGGGC